MATPVKMPELGESITEGTITRWIKQEGDRVEADEPLFEVSTDKVDTEVPSPVAGVLKTIKVQADETVEVGAELAIIDEGPAGEATEEGAEEEPEAEAEAEAAGGEQEAEEAAQPDEGSEEAGTEEQRDQALFNGREIKKEKFPHQIAFNCIPHIDVFLANGYTKEEWKMIQETRKILEEPSLPVTATSVRVPVFCSHSESVNIETEKKLTAEQAKTLLRGAPGVMLLDVPQENIYPMAIDAVGKDATYVGRVREDDSVANGLNLWVVADNLRKGAALNAVQIAEILIRDYI